MLQSRLALRIDDTGEALNCGGAADVTDLGKGTVIAIVKLDTAPGAAGHPERILSKGANWQLGFTDVSGAPNIQMFINRATQSLLVNVNATSFSPATVVGLYYALYVTFDLNGAATDQKVYRGSDIWLPAEPGSYNVQRAGSDAIVTNAGTDLWVGNNPAATTQALEGSIFFIGLLKNVLLSRGEITRLHKRLVFGRECVTKALPGAVLWSYPGAHGVGPVVDWSGLGNHGAIQGSPTLAPAPLARAFKPFGRRVAKAPLRGIPPGLLAANAPRPRLLSTRRRVTP